MALLLAPVLLAALDLSPRTTITVLGLSDYHSHAAPFYSEGRPGQGGIARAVAFLREARKDGRTLVLSGGDTLNEGTPVWSDEHRCVEWPWLDGLVDAMALGNHELDYGAAVFEACRRSVRYPVLAANLVGPDGHPLLTAGGKPYLVREVGGVKIGAFAVAGPDFGRLVAAEDLPPGTRFLDPVEAARRVVAALREQEGVAAVVLFGHQHRQDDEALVRAVPGIDLVLGTHSHYKSPLRQVEGTSTYYISPFQYLTYIARVRLTFAGGRLDAVEGELVPVDPSLPEDASVAAKVQALARELREKRPDRFRVLGRANVLLGDEGATTGESLIGNWATDVLRRAAGTHVFVSTASSFRAALPAGDVTVEDFYAAIPYKNRLVTTEMTGAELVDLVRLSAEKAGSDGFSQQSGMRYARKSDGGFAVEVLRDPARPELGYAPVEPTAVYRVGTTDFQALVASGYRELFARASRLTRTELDAHAVLRAAFAAGPVTARLDGRSRLTP